LFTLQFKLEDLSNPLASIPEPQQQQEGESEANTIKTEPELINIILTCTYVTLLATNLTLTAQKFTQNGAQNGKNNKTFTYMMFVVVKSAYDIFQNDQQNSRI